MSTHQPIAIIGAGLSGLMLARILYVHGIESAVYDLDSSPNVRAQGGMLDIHENSGQVALRAGGLFDQFLRIIYPGGDAMRIMDKHAVIHMADDGNRARPEVTRGSLRNLLISALPENAIHWGAKVVNAQTLTDGRHEVSFADGSIVTADLLVGADGAWSKVRSLVTNVTPDYSGISFVEVHLLNVDVQHPDAAALIGPGVLFALSDEKGFIFHRDPDNSLHGYIALKTRADWGRSINFTATDNAKATLHSYFEDWDERLQHLITEADGTLVPRTIDALPVGHRWVHKQGVTLLGDAAHLMSPFAGEGANLALQDGAELATALVEHPNDIDTALDMYEQAMFSRGAASAQESANNLTIFFQADAPQGLVDLMLQHQTGTI